MSRVEIITRTEFIVTEIYNACKIIWKVLACLGDRAVDE